MQTISYHLYKITALTNMHVGSGDMNFGVIDNLVQRDHVSGFPYISSSSLKGAVREFFNHSPGEFEKNRLIPHVFGSEPKSEKKEKGEYRFFSANLLSIPVRSNSMPFFRAVTLEIMEEFRSALKQFDIKVDCADDVRKFCDSFKGELAVKKDSPYIFEEIEQGRDVYIEDYKTRFFQKRDLVTPRLLGDHVALFHDENLRDICRDLPVVARNQLENGTSVNLWYEEIIPRQTEFYFILGVPVKDSYHHDFQRALEAEPVQIGANASIGYGFTRIEKVDNDSLKRG